MTWQILNRILVILGFFVLVIYTRETYKLRKIGNDQKDLQIMPLPFLYLSRTGNPTLEITNFGSGTAVDIKIKTASFKYKGKQKAFEFEVNYGSNILEYKNKKFVSVIFYDDGDKKSPKLSGEAFYMYYAADGKSMTNKGKCINITYKDIKAQTYKQEQHFGKQGTAISQLPKRIRK